MKHFAQIDEDNFVLQVAISESKNVKWFADRFGGQWIETSKKLTKNIAQVGGTYDSNLKAFINPKIFDSWLLNKETAQWEAPVPKPSDGKKYIWNEETVSWSLASS